MKTNMRLAATVAVLAAASAASGVASQLLRAGDDVNNNIGIAPLPSPGPVSTIDTFPMPHVNSDNVDVERKDGDAGVWNIVEPSFDVEPPTTSTTTLKPAIDLVLDSMRHMCNLQQTDELLGYKVGTREAVYKNRCVGWCLSLISQPHSCQSTTEVVAVSKFPLVYSLNTRYVAQVEQVTACSCQPRQCEVHDDDDGSTHMYAHGATVVDACHRKCTCEYGTLVNCCRRRKEYRTGLSTSERQRYINTYKIASTTAPYKAEFDALMVSHGVNFSAGIHGTQWFFPWHRWYILELENLLRKIDCRVTIPYWDWSLQAAAPFTSSSTIWKSGANELGGDSGGACVSDGAFASPWTTADGVCLRRSFNTASAAPADPATIAGYTAANPSATAADYDGFTGAVNLPHGQMHGMIGSTMSGTSTASTAPEFFLHHGFIDKVWSDWQKQSALHVQTYSSIGTKSDLMPATSGNIAAEDVNDLAHQYYQPSWSSPAKNEVCVEYENPRPFWWVSAILEKLPLYALNALPKLRVDASPHMWFDAMRGVMPAEDLQAIFDAADARNDASLHVLLDRDSVLKGRHGEFAREMGVSLNDSRLFSAIEGKLIVSDECTGEGCGWP